ncbi:MAG: hypothetical protein IJ201_10760 [Solobacterium sp.]|nr:hypothetical protein [Solobacterium sp.]
MFRRFIGAAVASAAAIGITAVVKLMLDEENKKAEEEPEDENEVRFISIDDGGKEPEKAAEEAPAEAKAPEYSKEVNEIAELYPYLAKDFIAEQLGRNEVFNQQYPEDSLIKITHKAKFDSTDTVRDFTKIGEDNGYFSEMLNENEATISRKIFTEDGSILSDIYNVANQVACLKGIYEGYNIEL